MPDPMRSNPYGMSKNSTTTQPAKTTTPSKPTTLAPSDLYALNTLAQSTSAMMNMALAQQQNEINQAMNLYAERMKAQQNREATMRKIQDAIAKTESAMQKCRIKTAMDVSKAFRSLLLGD